MTTQESSRDSFPFIPLFILLMAFALLLLVLLLNTSSISSVPPSINGQNVGRLHEIMQFHCCETKYPIRKIAIDDNAKQLLVTSGNMNGFWNLTTGIGQVSDLRNSGGSSLLVFFKNGRAATALMDSGNHLSILDMTDGTLLRYFGSVGYRGFSVTQDGEWLVSSPDEATLILTNIITGQQRFTITTPEGYHFSRTNATFSADGKLLATTLQRNDGMFFDVFLWDAYTGKLFKKLGAFSVEEGGVMSIAFSHDGQRLAVGGTIYRDNGILSHIQLWDIPTPSVLATWTGELGSVSISRLTFTPDDHYFAAEAPSEYGVWKVEDFITTGKPIAYELDGQAHRIAFSPDGTLMVISTNAVITVYAVRTGERLVTLNGHRGRIVALVFSRDGRLLVSASQDNTVRFWSINEDNPYPALSHPQDDSIVPAVMTPTVP